MSIFGQVWLWSLLAFVVGALLTWLVLVRPARKRIRELEGQLNAAHAETARVPANVSALAGGTPFPAQQAQQAPEDDEPDFSPAASYPATVAEHKPVVDYPETVVEKPVYFETGSGEATDPDYPETVIDQAREQAWAEADTADEPHEAEQTRIFEPAADYRTAPESEAVTEDPYHAAATQYLSPVSGEAEVEYVDPEPAESAQSSQSDVEFAELEHQFAEDEPAYQPEPPYRSSLEARLDPGAEAQPELPDPESVSMFQPPPRHEHVPAPDWFDHEPSPERSPFEEPPGENVAAEQVEHVAPEPEDEPAYAFGGDTHEEVVPESAAESTQLLPKRQPRESPRGGFEQPRPIQPSMRAVERREPSPELTGGHSGSLFEPSVQPSQSAAQLPPAPEPPPARHANSDSVPPGPFGPGSAMPRPGGGRPADEFTVKASVTALRYCTDESPQFPRMVAEVWFRNATDAERVGFRPLT
ncbi:sunset domain-containing protein [Amycolatopsis sp. H20-H5]|uniref:sunset domain-containing protein n=1 Tax=Amycolatopsis sp. H20-H5 TaxID=3046309 RepID=UPI002DBC648D|nr:hypothetical protein [Amycolatopsis sp. H20-H5]MEC3976555.1 hypothetical protein [Amycolatopsis sp. H20-H5]